MFASKFLMNKIGYSIETPGLIILAFGGMRGAVGLSLAMIVSLDTSIPAAIGDVVIFHTAGIALMTLLINGSLTGVLVKQMGMSRLSNAKKKMMIRSRGRHYNNPSPST